MILEMRSCLSAETVTLFFSMLTMLVHTVQDVTRQHSRVRNKGTINSAGLLFQHSLHPFLGFTVRQLPDNFPTEDAAESAPSFASMAGRQHSRAREFCVKRHH